MRAPPYLVSFDDVEDYFQALSKDSLIEHKTQIIEIIGKKLPPVVSIRCLAVLFGFSPKLIGSLLMKTENYYRVFDIRKGKKKRRIEAPKVGLKVIQKWIAEYLGEAIELHGCVHGFVPKKSYITAAQKHLNARWVYSIDIENFFQSTPQSKVEKAFITLGYPEKGARIAAKLCCYKKHLAQGSPASPVLSNIIFRDIDKEIYDIAESLDINYTRYADDLVFSGRGDFPDELKAIKQIIEKHDWKLSEHKEQLFQLPRRLKVHGLLVHGDIIRLTKGYRNRIRAFKHLVKSGKISKNELPKINGHINLARHIDQAQ